MEDWMSRGDPAPWAGGSGIVGRAPCAVPDLRTVPESWVIVCVRACALRPARRWPVALVVGWLADVSYVRFK